MKRTIFTRFIVLIPAFTLASSAVHAQLGGGAAGTAAQGMWDKHTFDKMTKGAESVAGKSSSPEAKTLPTSPTVAPKPADVTFTPLPSRENASGFSAECPPGWVAEHPLPNSLRFSSNAARRVSSDGSPWVDFSIEMVFFSTDGSHPSKEDLREGSKSIIAQAIQGEKVELSEPVQLAEVSTIFGNGLEATYQHPTEFHYNEAHRLLFLIRPTNGVFWVTESNPASDSSLRERFEQIFKSLMFEDKTRAEVVRESVRR